ncbi:MAG: hypothetical protein K8S18_05225 [Desulfobacula sp.]|nr:hypothetical protein [Desulfobacula sp.]
MKITDPDVIKNGEKDLIEAVQDDLDLDAVKEVLKKRMASAALSSKGGEIMVYNNEIAFRLDFDIQLSGSLMFDRQGNYIPESDKTADDEADESERLMSEDFDLDDLDINETLEEVAPQTRVSETKDAETETNDIGEEEQQSTSETMEEELDIDLPDYDLDDELNPESGDYDENEGENIDTKKIADSDGSDIAMDDLEQLMDEPESESEIEKDDLIPNDIVDDDIADDDDINGILKESQAFWEEKKDS